MNTTEKRHELGMGTIKFPVRAPWTYNVDLVFLVGSPRSGTTWFQAMIASHPDIYTGTETAFFMTFASAEEFFLRTKPRRIGFSEYLSKEEFYSFMAELFWRGISTLPKPPTVPRFFLEATNSHCLHADFILKTFPRARFVHLVRDGRAVVASMLRGSRKWAQQWAEYWGSVDSATRAWTKHVRAARTIAHKTRDANQYLEVRYEDLRKNPQKELSRLFEWLGLPANEPLISSIVDSHSIDRVRAAKKPFPSIPMTKESAVKPEANTAYPKDFIGPAPRNVEEVDLSRLQRRRVEYLAGALLRELGYSRNPPQLSLWERIGTSTRVRRMLKLPRL